MGVETTARCFCCGSRDRKDLAGDWQQCLSCGARWRVGDNADMLRYRKELVHLTTVGPVGAETLGDRDWFVDAVTLRIAGTRHGLWYACTDPAAFQGHRDARPDGVFHDLNTTPALSVALVLLARRDDDSLRTALASHEHAFAEIVVVLDTDDRIKVPGTNVTTVCRPLDGDFANQRNGGNHAASASWVFHLDLDEIASPDLTALLGRVAYQAQAAGLRAVGLPRRNRVDGVLSDLYPDTQYRLMPRTERFENRVHERPVACRDWTRTSICLKAPIVHDLTRSRVEERSRHYDALGQSTERDEDTRRLLMLYHD